MQKCCIIIVVLISNKCFRFCVLMGRLEEKDITSWLFFLGESEDQ